MQKITVLIADDHTIVRRGLRSLLQTEKDIEVIGSCASAIEALKLTEEQSPDLILLDVQMPRMDGFEFLRALKLEKLPLIIFVTAHDHYALGARHRRPCGSVCERIKE